MNLASLLTAGLDNLGIVTTTEQRQKMLDYVGLLEKWNKAYNLTAVRDAPAMVSRHLLDSLVIEPWLTEADTLDVGTGAGLPGIPLAIIRPQQDFVLIDSNGKKTRFVQQAITELGLNNVSVIQQRAEQHDGQYAQIISRAFAALPAMVALTENLLLPGGRLLAMKGVLTDMEMAGITAHWSATIKPLFVPGLEESRHLVILEQADT